MQQLFNHSVYQQRLKRVIPREHFLLETMAEMAADRLQDINRHFKRVVVMSPMPTSLVSHPKCTATRTLEFPLPLREGIKGKGFSLLTATPNPLPQGERGFETLPLEEASLDALISLGILHHTNDVPGVLAQAAQALKPDGLFLALFLGGDTLVELREMMMEAELAVCGGASMRVHPTIDVRDAGALLQRAGFALPVVDDVTLNASYETVTHLMHDLRSMNETNILEKRSRVPMTRKVLAEINRIYAKKYSDEEGRIRARFDIIAMTGWKPHASQQQPSARGSGKVSLTVLE